MGYTTEFDGQFAVDPPLKPEHAEYLQKFADTRRMKRDPRRAKNLLDLSRQHVGLPIGEEGGYFVGGVGYLGQGDDESITDHNKPPIGQPDLWCHWTPTANGHGLEFNGREKFYRYVAWLEYLIAHFLRPWGYSVSGTVSWAGERGEDTGTITIHSNIVTAKADL